MMEFNKDTVHEPDLIVFANFLLLCHVCSCFFSSPELVSSFQIEEII